MRPVTKIFSTVSRTWTAGARSNALRHIAAYKSSEKTQDSQGFDWKKTSQEQEAAFRKNVLTYFGIKK